MNASATGTVSLRAAAQACRFHIGAAVAVRPLLEDPRYGEVLAREFTMVTAENAMKWPHLRPSRGVFDFSGADEIVRFAERHGMRVRGHTLVWHHGNPKWLEQGAFDRRETAALLREHIYTVVGHYRGRVAYWDVVNEAVGDATEPLRQSFWLRQLGPEYLDLAFRWAHEADPAAKLVYNDYGAEGLNEKSERVFALVRGLLERCVPIHGVGLQMHVNLSATEWLPDLAQNMERLAALGLEVQVTELDVRLKKPIDAADRQAQAALYADILRTCLAAPGCSALVLWGFTDRASWIPHYYENHDEALIFDREYAPKPAHAALVKVLRERCTPLR